FVAGQVASPSSLDVGVKAQIRNFSTRAIIAEASPALSAGENTWVKSSFAQPVFLAAGDYYVSFAALAAGVTVWGNNPGSFTNEDMIFANDGAWMMSDGANWTTWDTTAVIEYTLNTAPNTPPTNNPKGTQTTPAIITTTTPTLDWSFSDSNAGDIQSAYQVRVR
ncbi:hypothetical protein, partial [Pseudomonas sp. GP01-A3]|uniref:hypothetical protein n=1 Tax=Pseudomonas sp. GP01-A3 TaxID=2070568 RepID=UPI001304AB68